MNTRKEIPLEEFDLTISPPVNRLASMCVNIYAEGRFNLNGKLIEKIGSRKLSIRFTRNGKYLCLGENGDISFPKGGSRKLPDMIDQLQFENILPEVQCCRPAPHALYLHGNKLQHEADAWTLEYSLSLDTE